MIQFAKGAYYRTILVSSHIITQITVQPDQIFLAVKTRALVVDEYYRYANNGDIILLTVCFSDIVLLLRPS